ncbi:MAG: prepilin-type N-terminal cleavage/methylation domain-containing protein [Phycisphaera sp.]|nr:prepilin-type N-terminal cleavage/methylation domain-containing protein [Phycisphaera sp.]
MRFSCLLLTRPFLRRRVRSLGVPRAACPPVLKTYGFFTGGQADSGTPIHTLVISAWLLTHFLAGPASGRLRIDRWVSGGPVNPSLSGGEMAQTRAFTLVELIIVITVLGILGALVIPMFARGDTQAMTAATQSNLRAINQQAVMYQADHGSMPDAIDPAWFPNNKVPANPFDSSHPHNVQNLDSAITDPTYKVIHRYSSGHHGWWYNTRLGVLRARPDDVGSYEATLQTYNAINGTDQTDLGKY